MTDENSVFTDRVLHHIKMAAQTDEEGLALLVTQYSRTYLTIPGAPAPEDITIDDTPVIAGIAEYTPELGTWEQFSDLMRERKAREFDAINPYMPKWFSKTGEETDQNPWMRDCGNICGKAEAMTALNILMAEARPQMNRKLKELLIEVAPVPAHESKYLDEVIETMQKVYQFFLWAGGDTANNPEWAWAPCITFLGGLGVSGFRKFAKGVAHTDETWMHWASATDDEIATDILEAQSRSGYPVALIRSDFPKVCNALAGFDLVDPVTQETHIPRWFTALLALHLIKHTRYWPDFKGEPHLFVAYRGQTSFLKIHKDGVNQSLMSAQNLPMAKDLCRVLRIPFPTRQNDDWYHQAASQALKIIHPFMLSRPRAPEDEINLIIGPQVSYAQRPVTQQYHRWVNAGIDMTNVAQVNPDGMVSPKADLSEVDSLVMRWPIEEPRASDIGRWRSIVPSQVFPERASSVILRSIRNINHLGNPDGLAAIIDAILTCDILRNKLPGCPIGNLLPYEFPLMFVLPTDGTPEGSTNQGKTNLCRVIGGAIAPNIKSVSASNSSSPPVQRAIADPIRQHGTAILDEFLMPRSHDHFIGQAGLQSLATGSMVTPGLVGENDGSLFLRHPLFLAAKIGPNVPDIINRSMPIFLDSLTEENSATDAELTDILSGKLSLEVRLRHILWMIQSGIEQTIMGGNGVPPLNISRGVWRFNAHLAVASHLSSQQCVSDYLERARTQCEKQLAEADDSGMADDIGIAAVFRPDYYFETATEYVLKDLEEETSKKYVPNVDILRTLVENGDLRRFDNELRSYGLREKAGSTRLLRALQKAPMERGDWRMRYVPKEISDRRDNKGRTRGYVVVERITDAPDPVQGLLDLAEAPKPPPPPPPPPPNPGSAPPPPPPPPPTGGT